MPRPRERSTLLKSLPRAPGRDRARQGDRSRPDRGLVRGIFGAICPGDGKGAALVLPACNTEAMNLHLAEIAAEVTPGKHAVLGTSRLASWFQTTSRS